MHSCLLVVNVIGTSISVGWSKYDIFYFFSKKLLASVVKVPAATSQLLFWTPTSVEWPQKSLEFQVRFIQSCYILGGQRDWGKGVHCGNVSVNNNANGFCFKRHTIHITANSHACGLKTSISRQLTLVGQFLTPDWKMWVVAVLLDTISKNMLTHSLLEILPKNAFWS